MSLSKILKKASNFILGTQSEIQPIHHNTEGGVIFSKNNVCVHPPTLMRQDTDIIHHPGYLTLTAETNNFTNKPTLVLSWIPNASLRRNPSSVEQRSFSASRLGERRQSSELSGTPEPQRRRSADCAESYTTVPNSEWLEDVETRLKRESQFHSLGNSLIQGDSTTAHDIVPEEITSDTLIIATENCQQIDSCDTMTNLLINPSTIDIEVGSRVTEMNTNQTHLSETQNKIKNTPVPKHDKDKTSEKRHLYFEKRHTTPVWMVSPELLALQHNLNFPDSSTTSPVVRRSHRVCRKFTVDLSAMRSLRLFFCDVGNTQGQLVVASQQCQYKILHFHHGGLDRLADVLQTWNLLVVEGTKDQPYRHFMVCRPEVREGDLHPEEGSVSEMTQMDWQDMLNSDGQLEDDLPLRKAIFLGGLSPSVRKTVWPFLLLCYSFQSTYADREHISQIRHHEYTQITGRREALEGVARERFLRNIQSVVEKDVVRTDRSNPYYAGENNPHVYTMMRILLNYAIYNSNLGYTQGMSDLLAPILVEIEEEAEAFWCFVGLMQRGMFVCTPTDSDMEHNLNYLRELIREMVPEFYAHLQKYTDGMELLFCHRWILLCFKREFPEATALRIWEACWSNYLTDHFHLFLCVAIVSAYADDVIAQDLRTDEMLLHFSSLAMFMDGDLILRKARGLLYQFRERSVIPCTLAGLCQLCGPGMWDSAHVPTVVCRGTTDLCPKNPCPYRGISLHLQ